MKYGSLERFWYGVNSLLDLLSFAFPNRCFTFPKILPPKSCVDSGRRFLPNLVIVFNSGSKSLRCLSLNGILSP